MTGALALQLLVYGVTNGAVVALNAVGFTLAYAVSRQINLAHGNVFALATVVVASLAAVLGIPASAPLAVRAGALLLLAVCGAACGALLNTAVEQLAFRPFRRFRAPLGPLIATVGLSFLLLQARSCCCRSRSAGAQRFCPSPAVTRDHTTARFTCQCSACLSCYQRWNWGGVACRSP